MKIYNILLSLVLYVALILTGFCIHIFYDEWNNERTLNGLYIYNSDNISETKEYAKSRDSKGDWVCINVAYDMRPKEAYDTCIHECSHKAFTEIYAEKCESEPLTCLEGLYEE